jgi:hypothetical protein
MNFTKSSRRSSIASPKRRVHDSLNCYINNHSPPMLFIMELNIFSYFNSIFNLYPNPSNACLSPNHKPTLPTPTPSVSPLLSQPPIAGPTSPVTRTSPNHSMRNNRSNQRLSLSSSRPSRPRKQRSRSRRSRRNKHISSHSMPRRSLEAESSHISRLSREDSRLKN